MAAKRKKKAGEVTGGMDTVLFLSVFALVGIGLVMVYSASCAVAFKTHGSDTYFVKRQAVFACMGFISLLVLWKVPYRIYRALAYPILGLAVLFLFLVFVPGIGLSAGGATRWVRLGPVSFQPSEILRLAVIIWLAYSMAKKKEAMADFSIGVVPHIIVAGVLAGILLLQPDFGSAVLLSAVIGVMLFLGGARIRHLLLLAAAFLPLAGIFIVRAEYRLKRLMTFWDPWSCQSNEGYQIVHSLMAFGTGGVPGVGIGKGYQKLFYLPEPHTDFVFSVLGEELGLWGVGVVVCLYLLIIWRGLIIAKRAPDLFGTYLAAGIVVALGLQTSVNMAVTMGLLPTKGLTLPFLSYGGTSLLLNLAAIGILANVAAYTKPQPVNVRTKPRARAAAKPKLRAVTA